MTIVNKLFKIKRKLTERKEFTMKCKKCQREKIPHWTEYTVNRSCSVLCEECWKELTPDQRLPYYMALCNRWDLYYEDPATRELVRKNVLENR